MDSCVKSELKECLTRRCVLVGVGNTARGDDGFGPLLVRKLRGKTSLALVDAGSVPENWLGPIGQMAPSVVIVADAVSLEAPAGSLCWVPPEKLEGVGVSTHAPSLDMFVSFLKQTIAAEVYILGAVPEKVGFNEPVSAVIRRAIDEVTGLISALSPPAPVSGLSEK